jgi:hypothetical protein
VAPIRLHQAPDAHPLPTRRRETPRSEGEARKERVCAASIARAIEFSLPSDGDAPVAE